MITGLQARLGGLGVKEIDSICTGC